MLLIFGLCREKTSVWGRVKHVLMRDAGSNDGVCYL